MRNHACCINSHALCSNGLNHLRWRQQTEFGHFTILIHGLSISGNPQVINPQDFMVPTSGHGSASGHLAIGQCCRSKTFRQACLFRHFADNTALQRLMHRQTPRSDVVKHARVGRFAQRAPPTPHETVLCKTVDMHGMAAQTKKSKCCTLHFKCRLQGSHRFSAHPLRQDDRI